MSNDSYQGSRSKVEDTLNKYLPCGRSSSELDVAGIDPAYAELEWRRMLVADAYEAYLTECLQSGESGNEPEALAHVATSTGEDLEFIFEVLDVCRKAA
jgi:hypothetical protein